MRPRSVPLYAGLAVLTTGAGLASRRYPAALPGFVAQYGGDTLWAAMVFWLLALLARRSNTIRLAVITLVIAFAVEFSQMYHAPWADSIRSTRLGALIFGSDFVWSDLVCYAVGVALAATLDGFLTRREGVAHR